MLALISFTDMTGRGWSLFEGGPQDPGGCIHGTGGPEVSSLRACWQAAGRDAIRRYASLSLLQYGDSKVHVGAGRVCFSSSPVRGDTGRGWFSSSPVCADTGRGWLSSSAVCSGIG